MKPKKALLNAGKILLSGIPEKGRALLILIG